MGIFVGQKSPAANPCAPVRKVIGARTVLTRLVMLKAFAADGVADRKKKIIAIIVVRVEKLLRLDYQVFVELQFFRSDFKIGWFVSKDIEVHGIIRPSGEVYALEVSAGIKRRVDQRIQRRFLELNHISVLRFQVQGTGKLPSLRQADRSFEFDITRKVSSGIQKHTVPGNVCELRGNAASS